jgi:hypothetical protein
MCCILRIETNKTISQLNYLPRSACGCWMSRTWLLPPSTSRWNDDVKQKDKYHHVQTLLSQLRVFHQYTSPTTMSDQKSLKLLANYGVTGFLLSTGLLALLSPTTMAALFGMPIQDDTFAAGFMQCIGGRNLTFGIIASIFLQRRDLRAVATMATLLAVDGCIDGVVTYKYSGVGAALPHFGAAAIIPFVRAWMSS